MAPRTSPEPDFRPGPGDYDWVRRRARRIRVVRHRAVAAQAALVAAVVAAAVMVTGGGGSDRLRIDEVRDPVTTPTPTPAPSAPRRPTPTSGVSGVALPGPSATRTAARTPGSPAATLPLTAAPRPTPSESVRTRVPRADAAAEYEYRPGAAPSSCATDAAEHDRGGLGSDSRNWCEYYAGPPMVQTEFSNDLAFDVCRAPATGPGVLDGGGRALLTLDVYDLGGNPLWSWTGHTPPGDTVEVAPGDCVRWTVTWDGLGDDGKHPVDRVVLDPAYHAESFSGWNGTYTVRVQ